MGFRFAAALAAIPLKKRPLSEYLYLLAFVGFFTAVLAEAGWGWWSLLGMPIFLGALCFLVLLFVPALPGISATAGHLVYRPIGKGGNKRLPWAAITSVKVRWWESVHPMTGHAEVRWTCAVNVQATKVVIPGIEVDGRRLFNLFRLNLPNFEREWQVVEAEFCRRPNGEVQCWSIAPNPSMQLTGRERPAAD